MLWLPGHPPIEGKECGSEVSLTDLTDRFLGEVIEGVRRCVKCMEKFFTASTPWRRWKADLGEVLKAAGVLNAPAFAQSSLDRVIMPRISVEVRAAELDLNSKLPSFSDQPESMDNPTPEELKEPQPCS